MIFRTVQEVTDNLDDLFVLQELMRIEPKSRSLWEKFFLRDIVSDFTSHQISVINYMKEKFNNNEETIRIEPELLETHTFLYKKERSTIKFHCSNDMSFHHDIMIICYLNEVLNRRCSHEVIRKSTIMHTLIKLMKTKYDIKLLTICNSLEPSHINPEDITTFNVALSFPSIALTVFYYVGSPFCSRLLPSFKLPRIIFAPTFISVLPKSAKNPPFAILMAILVKSDCLLRSQTSQTPLTTIFEYVLKCYKSNSLPETLKLNLCIKWHVVVKHKKEYKFITRLTLYRQKAKNLIAELKPNDPDLEDILSKI